MAKYVSLEKLSLFKTKIIELINDVASGIGSNNVDNTVVFNSDGSITENYIDGKSEKTVFNTDGSIVTTSYENGVVTKIETTVFNADGTISTTYIEGGNA